MTGAIQPTDILENGLGAFSFVSCDSAASRTRERPLSRTGIAVKLYLMSGWQ